MNLLLSSLSFPPSASEELVLSLATLLLNKLLTGRQICNSYTPSLKLLSQTFLSYLIKVDNV